MKSLKKLGNNKLNLEVMKKIKKRQNDTFEYIFISLSYKANSAWYVILMIVKTEERETNLYELGFEVGQTRGVCPRRTSCYYYSASLSYDDRYIAFFIEGHIKRRELHDKVAIWGTRKKETVNVFEVLSGNKECNKEDPGPSIHKIEFMPSKNQVAILCRRGGRLNDSILIYSIDGELIKEIEFPSHIEYSTMGSVPTKTLFYKHMFNFAVSPDSKRIAISLNAKKVYKMGGPDIPVITDEEAMRPRPGTAPPRAVLIYDIENDEIINLIREDKLGCFFGGRLMWPVDKGIVRTTFIPPKQRKKNTRRMVRLMGYATMINPYTEEVLHRVPVRYSNSRERLKEPHLYTAIKPMKYSPNAYFVDPHGEYVAIVNKYIDIARFSDFDSKGNHLVSGPKWQTVNDFRRHVGAIEWIPPSSELIYQYKENLFVTWNYKKNKVSRLISLNKKVNAVRILWDHGNTIYFLNYDCKLHSIGIFKL